MWLSQNCECVAQFLADQLATKNQETIMPSCYVWTCCPVQGRFYAWMSPFLSTWCISLCQVDGQETVLPEDAVFQGIVSDECTRIASYGVCLQQRYMSRPGTQHQWHMMHHTMTWAYCSSWRRCMELIVTLHKLHFTKWKAICGTPVKTWRHYCSPTRFSLMIRE